MAIIASYAVAFSILLKYYHILNLYSCIYIYIHNPLYIFFFVGLICLSIFIWCSNVVLSYALLSSGGSLKLPLIIFTESIPWVNFISAYYAQCNSLSMILHINLEKHPDFAFRR